MTMQMQVVKITEADLEIAKFASIVKQATTVMSDADIKKYSDEAEPCIKTFFSENRMHNAAVLFYIYDLICSVNESWEAKAKE